MNKTQTPEGAIQACDIRVYPEGQSKKTQDNNTSGLLPFDEVEPYPGLIEPEQLLTEVSTLLKRFIVMNDEQADAVALWIAQTWFVENVEVLALLIITAPEKACGKSVLLDVVSRLSARPLMASNISTAGLFRSIEVWQPTMLIDEADTFIREKLEFKGLINAGHTRSSAFVLRVVGESFEPKSFSVWGAKALAGIRLEKHLSDATRSRGIIINMRKKMPNDNVERIRHANKVLFETLASKLAKFSQDYAKQVKEARPELPEALSDRAQDNWEPLLAIAECAGLEWKQRAQSAAIKLSKEESSSSTSNKLLADIQHVFLNKEVDKISTVDLIEALSSNDESPWATYNQGNQVSPRQLAKLLGSYGVKSKTLRFGHSTPKGYDIGQFQDVFSRYLDTFSKLPKRRNDSPEVMPVMEFSVSDEVKNTGNDLQKTRNSAKNSLAIEFPENKHR